MVMNFTLISEITSADMWVNVKAEVLQLWENHSPAISQVGLIKDGSGIMKFVCWKKANMPEVEIGDKVTFENAVTSEYQGKISLTLNSKSRIIIEV